MIPAWVEGVAIAVEPYGSRVTCDPPPTDTDEDWLVLVTEFDTLHYALVDTGFARSDREYAGAHTGLPCRFYRRGELNVQVTTDREYFRRSMVACNLAKQFNLLNKVDRIALYTAVADQLYHYALPDETVEF